MVRCDRCGRPGRNDEPVGTTCGEPIDRPFVPDTPEAWARRVWRMRRGLPSEDIARDRCLGALQPEEPVCAPLRWGPDIIMRRNDWACRVEDT